MSKTNDQKERVYHSYKALRLEQAYIWVRRLKYGFKYGQKIVSLRGNLGNKEFCKFVPVSNTLFLSSYLLSESTASDYFKKINSFKPVAIEAYPSSLYNLALLFQKLGLSLSIPLCFTSSETLYPFQREIIERVFSSKIYDRYGCTERTISLAQNIDQNGYYEEPGYSLNEYHTDHIITTSLINSAFPLIRYRVDDSIITSNTGAVESICGRSEDVIVCVDGTKIGRLDHIFKGVSGVAFAQIIQHSIGEIDINIVPDITFNNKTFSSLLQNLKNKVSEKNLQVKIKKIQSDDIIYTSRNKFSLVKSYIENK